MTDDTEAVPSTAPVMMYSTAFCPYCVRALRLLDMKGVPYTEIEASSDPELKREMIQRSGRFTFPQIFVGERHIGGCDDMMALEARGELDPLLSAAAA